MKWKIEKLMRDIDKGEIVRTKGLKEDDERLSSYPDRIMEYSLGRSISWGSIIDKTRPSTNISAVDLL